MSVTAARKTPGPRTPKTRPIVTGRRVSRGAQVSFWIGAGWLTVLVLLADQDRSRWHAAETSEALDLLRSLGPTRAMTPQGAAYLIQARIAAVHASAREPGDTRWDLIVGHYDTLLQVAPTPAAALARAVAVAESQGPEAGLESLAEVDLVGSHRLPAVRAELLVRVGREDEARRAYDEAIALCRNEVELAHLQRRRDELGPRPLG